jgi:hypothetical protein
MGDLYYPERCPKKATYLVKASLFESLFRLLAILDVKPKIQHQLEDIGDQRIRRFQKLTLALRWHNGL